MILNISFRDFSNWRAIVGSVTFHLAIAGTLFNILVNTMPDEQPVLPEAIIVSVVATPPTPQAASAAPQVPVKQEVKNKGYITVKQQKKKKTIKQDQPSITKNAPVPAAKPSKNTVEDVAPVAKDSGASKEYTATLLAWLKQHKHYPRQARVSRMEGDAILYFRIDREGKVLDYQLVKSTGHYVLDDAVIKMITSANPVPPPPSQLAIAELNFRVPVKFSLN